MTYPEPEHAACPAAADSDRRTTLVVIVASALSLCATAVAGLLIALGLL